MPSMVLEIKFMVGQTIQLRLSVYSLQEVEASASAHGLGSGSSHGLLVLGSVFAHGLLVLGSVSPQGLETAETGAGGVMKIEVKSKKRAKSMAIRGFRHLFCPTENIAAIFSSMS